MRDVMIRGDVIGGDFLSFSPGVLGIAAALLDAFVVIDSGRVDSTHAGGVDLVAFDAAPRAGVALRGVGFRPIVDDAGDAARRAARDAFGHAGRPPEFVERLVLIGEIGEPIVGDLFGVHAAKLDVARDASAAFGGTRLVAVERPTLILARDDVGAAALLLEPVA